MFPYLCSLHISHSCIKSCINLMILLLRRFLSPSLSFAGFKHLNFWRISLCFTKYDHEGLNHFDCHLTRNCDILKMIKFKTFGIAFNWLSGISSFVLVTLSPDRQRNGWLDKWIAWLSISGSCGLLIDVSGIDKVELWVLLPNNPSSINPDALDVIHFSFKIKTGRHDSSTY